MATAVEPAAPTNQRERILDTALALMAEQGAGSTSMRQLARECGVNVAALYHYFPSKADILRSVIEERQYALRLRSLPDVDVDLPPHDRLVALILAMWHGAQEEEQIWRLLLGESLRGDETALAVGRELLDVIEPALRAWVAELFPAGERSDRHPEGFTVDADSVARVVLGQLFSFFMGQLFRPPDERDARARREAEAIADLALPS
jgi:AcrR family transcriptional regulator